MIRRVRPRLEPANTHNASSDGDPPLSRANDHSVHDPVHQDYQHTEDPLGVTGQRRRIQDGRSSAPRSSSCSSPRRPADAASSPAASAGRSIQRTRSMRPTPLPARGPRRPGASAARAGRRTRRTRRTAEVNDDRRVGQETEDHPRCLLRHGRFDLHEQIRERQSRDAEQGTGRLTARRPR